MEIRNDLMIRIREAERRAKINKIKNISKVIISAILMYSVAVLFIIAFGR